MGWTPSGSLQALAEYLGRLERSFAVHAKELTTDATPKILFEVELPVNQTTHIEAVVVARRTGGSSGATNDGASYTVRVTGKNTAGTAAAIGSSITAIGESQAAWDVTIVASGNALQIKVTGAANNTISWVAHVKTLSHGG